MASDTTPKSNFGLTVTWGGHDIGYLTDVKGPSQKADTIEISSHDSPNGFKQFVAGLRDGGEVTLEMKYIPGDVTGQKQMLADFQTGTERAVIFTFNDTSSIWTYNAIITAYNPDAGKVGSDRTLAVTHKINGKPTYAYA